MAVNDLGMAKLLKKHKKWDSATTNGLSSQVCNDDLEDDDEIENEEMLAEADDENMIREIYTDEEQQIGHDIEIITENKLAGSNVIEKLHKFKRKFKRVTSESIPLYKEEAELQAKKQTFHQFSPFVEISLHDQTVYIRKTTIVWLLQESEFISNDRLFRVRSKQPHSCITFTPSNAKDDHLLLPVIQKSVQVGDMCVFESKKHWRIGRIVQFARPGKKQKKTKSSPFTEQFKGCTAEVIENLGVMCTWYDQMKDSTMKFELSKVHESNYIPLSLYMYTLPIGCFNDDVSIDKQHLLLKKAPSAALFTKQEISITETCATFLNTLQAENSYDSRKGQGTDKIDGIDEIVVLSDSEEQESTNYWLKICSIKLYENDRGDILSGKWLSSLHMGAVQALLKSQFPDFQGLKDPILQLSVKTKLSLCPGSLQILHVDSNHWVTVSTCGTSDADFDAIVYDSKYTVLSTTTELLLSKLMHTQNEILQIQIGSVVKQSGDSDCGVFSAAYCTALAYNQDPSAIVYNQSMMRQHLVSFLENKMMIPFPQVRTRRPGRPLTVRISVYCYCRMPDNGSTMVQCDNCEKWYHLKCIGKPAIKNTWFCKYCTPAS